MDYYCFFVHVNVLYVKKKYLVFTFIHKHLGIFWLTTYLSQVKAKCFVLSIVFVSQMAIKRPLISSESWLFTGTHKLYVQFSHI